MTLRYRLWTDETGQTWLLEAETGLRVGAVRFSPDWQGDKEFSTAELMLPPATKAAIAAVGPCRMAWEYRANLGGQYLEVSFVGLDAEEEAKAEEG